MLRWMWCTLLTGFVLNLGQVVFAQAQFQGWHTDLKTASEVSRDTGKPIFLVFRCVR